MSAGASTVNNYGVLRPSDKMHNKIGMPFVVFYFAKLVRDIFYLAAAAQRRLDSLLFQSTSHFKKLKILSDVIIAGLV